MTFLLSIRLLNGARADVLVVGKHAPRIGSLADFGLVGHILEVRRIEVAGAILVLYLGISLR